jgi:hypothetical protein
MEDLQKAVFDALVADSDVHALVADRIFDRVTESAVFPYVSFGPADMVEDDAECIRMAEHTLQIDIWSRWQGGKREAYRIADACKRALHRADLSLATNALVQISGASVRVFMDSDGITQHGVLTVEATIEER